MPVLFFGVGCKLPYNAYIFITFLLEPLVNLLLPYKLVHTVVRIVFADKKCTLDKMCNRGFFAGCGTVFVKRYLSCKRTVKLHRGVFVDAFLILGCSIFQAIAKPVAASPSMPG